MERLSNNEVLILDGAIGTELQAMGVPMHPIAWCGEALYTQPYTVRLMHESYIHAGADIISTDTFSTLRHVLEASGYGDYVREINLRSVYLAQEARERAAGGRPVYIAGVMSNFGVGRHWSTGRLWGSSYNGHELTNEQATEYYEELAETLAEAGVDFFLLENLQNQDHRILALRAAKATGLPVWMGLTGAFTFAGYHSSRPGEMADRKYRNMTVERGLNEVLAEGGVDAVTALHTQMREHTPAVEYLVNHFEGPVASYPDSGRDDFIDRHMNRSVPNEYSVDMFVNEAKKWVDMGAQVIGGCCGYGLDYIKPLKEALPEKIEPRG
jgi:S-methylmethionine-dependent homocysteine/selenocysteine methylase